MNATDVEKCILVPGNSALMPVTGQPKSMLERTAKELEKNNIFACSNLYRNLDPSEKSERLAIGRGTCNLKNVWCSTQDFHRFLHDR